MTRPARHPATWSAATVGALAFVAVGLTIGDPGITWDEPPYLAAAKLELAWLSALPAKVAEGALGEWLSAGVIDAHWNLDPYLNPHPPFYKVLAGLGWTLLHPWIGDYAAFRLSSAALFGVLVAVLCLWAGRVTRSTIGGVAAAAAFALLPRAFGDAHIAATDMPLTAFWGIAGWFFWRAARDGRLEDVLLFGAFWGMALATKFTGLLLIVPLVAWALLHARRHLARTAVVGSAVALAVMLVLNPYLWPDPVGRYAAFVAQSVSREQWVPIATFYLGRSYGFVLPWHHAAVLTLVTVPLPILALAGAGALRLRGPAVRPLVSLCLIQIAFYQLVMALPSSPGHDGVRLFLPQFPYLALLAGIGFAAAWARVGEGFGGASAGRGRTAARAALVALFLAPPALGLVRSHPHELAYFNEVVGGARGAYARGFESTYWFDAATPAFLRRMERELPPRARVWAYPAPWHFHRLQDAGLLRDDIVFTDSLPSPFLLLTTRQGTFGPVQWTLHRRMEPLVAESYQGVPLTALYRWQ